MTENEDRRVGAPLRRASGMTCDAFREVAEAFALGVLDDGERLACAQHLAETARHAGCVDAVLDTQLVSARLAAVLPGRSVRPEAWQAIEAQVMATAGEATARGRRLWELADWLVAATVVSLYLYGAPVTKPRTRSSDGETAVRRPAIALPVSSR